MCSSPRRVLLALLIALMSLAAGPKASALPPLPIIGRSGLPWNAGVFTNQGSSAASVAVFESWRPRQVDSVMYFPGRDTWQNLFWLHPDVRNFAGIRVISLSPFPENMGTGGLAVIAAAADNSAEASQWKASS